MSSDRPLRIATRASRLARWQADWVAAELTARGRRVEIVEISTQGDREQRGPVTAIGGTGVFTKEVQSAVLAGEADVAVHSLKDLPTGQTAGLLLAATPRREEPVDALVATATLAELPAGARVGTGSQRRRAQLKALRPDLLVAGIRGNVDTRLAKLDAGEFDAILLAAAGLRRLGWGERIRELLAPPRMLPAPGQGSLGIECRADDVDAQAALVELDDLPTRLGVTAERNFLAALHGGCSAPVAAWGRIEGEELRLDGLVASLDGMTVLRASRSVGVAPGTHRRAQIEAAESLGDDLAAAVLAQGAAAIVDAARSDTTG
ncbi:MAG: hydroxymethylbilane synthase [Planctomycetales bacterium]|nr:hydroxymethylbilane synthase [Planctomycetales bacterium]